MHSIDGGILPSYAVAARCLMTLQIRQARRHGSTLLWAVPLVLVGCRHTRPALLWRLACASCCRANCFAADVVLRHHTAQCSLDCVNAHMFEGRAIKPRLKAVDVHDWYQGE